MDLSREKTIMAEMHRLNDASKQFWGQADTTNCTVPKLVDQFFQSTEETYPEFSKLHSFALQAFDHLGWIGLCQVYEYIFANDLDPGEEASNFNDWIFLGTSAIRDTEHRSLDERIRVAADLEEIFERSAEESGQYSETTMGHFYYGHPLKEAQPQIYLLKSKEWFERAIESDDFNECDHHDLQTLGNVFFELGDFKTAHHWYTKFVAAENDCGEACYLDKTKAENRLVECQQWLNKQ